MKKPLTTKMHGYLDYAVGILLLLLPYICGFSEARDATTVTLVLGVATILYSLATRYELGLMPLIPMKTHLMLDGASALFLIVSPWLFDFAERVYVPHVMVGIMEMGVVLLTRTPPQEVPHTSHSH